MTTTKKIPAKATVTVDGRDHEYDVFVDDGEVVLEPITRPGERGSYARSGMATNCYAYTRGGAVFQAAVDRAKELAAEFSIVTSGASEK